MLDEALDRRWEPVISFLLMEELSEVLARAKFRRWLTEEEAERFVGDLRRIADEVTDPPATRAQRVQDPDDEFLVALVGVARAEALVSGDVHLLGLADIGAPVVTLAEFFEALFDVPAGRLWYGHRWPIVARRA